MNHVSRLLLAVALATGSVSPALAQQLPAGQAAASPAAASLTDGEVRRVDRSTGKLSLKHAEIRNLDMPPMTMVFAVKDPSLLDKVKAGDKVRFTAEKLNGAYTVTSLEVVQ